MKKNENLQLVEIKDQVTSIDTERLQELSNFDSSPEKTLVVSVIDLFFEISTKQMNELEICKLQKDKLRLHKVAHSMKSSCANIGAHKLSHMCFHLEKATREPNQKFTDELTQIMSEMENELQLVYKDLNKIKHYQVEGSI